MNFVHPSFSLAALITLVRSPLGFILGTRQDVSHYYSKAASFRLPLGVRAFRWAFSFQIPVAVDLQSSLPRCIVLSGPTDKAPPVSFEPPFYGSIFLFLPNPFSYLLYSWSIVSNSDRSGVTEWVDHVLNGHGITSPFPTKLDPWILESDQNAQAGVAKTRQKA